MRTKKQFVKKTFLSLFVATLFLVLSNCKKEEPPPPPPPPPTNTQKLCDKNFKITAMTVDPGIFTGSVTVTDLYAQMDACEKDNTTNFKTNGTYTDDEGATKCSPTDPQTTSGTWVWSTNETVITVTEGGTSESYNVVTNDGTTLKMTYTFSSGGINYVMTMTLTKQ